MNVEQHELMEDVMERDSKTWGGAEQGPTIEVSRDISEVVNSNIGQLHPQNLPKQRAELEEKVLYQGSRTASCARKASYIRGWDAAEKKQSIRLIMTVLLKCDVQP